ncbi:zinc metalloprotease HtpX [Methanosphaera cuniculi]|uniref:zinc metalloprotease HtpX n=1 Tax=Methanosphaera cuniculi TaxID=1077256 RepID=UPI0026EF64D3|nr:zinc metalloprotease HtpX [Methanosphaera cuniculi]
MIESLKITLLLGFLTGILVVFGGIIGSIFKFGMLGAFIGLIISIIMNFISYFYSDKLALRANHAQIVTEAEAPRLHRIVGELAQNAGIKKPRVAIVHTNDPNAFATGRNQDNAVVAATTGIMQMLDDRELRGVLAHELGHVKNHDILIGSIAATMAGIITMVANIGHYAIFFSDDDGIGELVASILLIIFAPIAAAIIRMAISRSCEFKADRSGAEISHDPLALASALEKIERGVEAYPIEDVNPSNAHLYIINPFGSTAQRLTELFSTHPNTNERIKRLIKMSEDGNY